MHAPSRAPRVSSPQASDPDSVRVHMGYACSLAMQQRLPEARDTLAQLRFECPVDADICRLWSQVCRALEEQEGRFDLMVMEAEVCPLPPDSVLESPPPPRREGLEWSYAAGGGGVPTLWTPLPPNPPPIQTKGSMAACWRAWTICAADPP